MKKRLVSLVIAIGGIFVLTVPALAAVFGWSIELTESGGIAYTNTPFVGTVDNAALVTQGYLRADGLDSRVFDGTTALPHMLTTDAVWWVGDLPANTTKSFTYTMGNAPAASMPIIVGNGGYITTADNAALEPGDAFEIDISGYIDTSAGVNKYIVNKAGAITIQVTDDAEVTATVNDGSDHSIVLTGINSGDLLMRLFFNDGTLLFRIMGVWDTSPDVIGDITDNANDWLWNQNNVMPYINYITEYKAGVIPITQTQDVTTPGQRTFISGFAGGYSQAGERFVYGISPSTIDSFSFYLSKFGNPVGTAYVRVYPGGEYPPSSLMQTLDSIDVSTISNVETEYTFNATPASLIGWSDFTIMIEYTGGDNANGINVHWTNTLPLGINDYSAFYPGIGGWWRGGASIRIGYELTYTNPIAVLLYQPIDIISGTTLPDLDGTQNGVITFGTNPASVVAVPTTFQPLDVAESSGYSLGTGTSFISGVPAAIPNMYDEGETGGLIIDDFVNPALATADIPEAMFWYPIAFGVAIVLGFVAFAFTRQLLVQAIVSGVTMAFFCGGGALGDGLLPYLTVVIFAIEAVLVIIIHEKINV